jgi:pseudaminic acid biosynthesis-associated methylase
MSTEQLKQWESEFGDAYTERNAVDWHVKIPTWRVMVGDLKLNHVVEVGPNRGHNLQAIAELGCAEGNIIGVEPNRTAIEIARSSSNKFSVLHGNAFELPFVDSYADLVFTTGVLIHISLEDLPRAMSEIYRVSRRYILCGEYFAETETVIEYRGHTNLLWKRNFKQHYLDQFADLKVIKEGYWSLEDGFDRTHWWLFEKTLG